MIWALLLISSSLFYSYLCFYWYLLLQEEWINIVGNLPTKLYFFSPLFPRGRKLRKGKISTNFPVRVLGNSFLTERCLYFTATTKRKKTPRNDELRSTSTITFGNLILMWPSEIDLGRPAKAYFRNNIRHTDGWTHETYRHTERWKWRLFEEESRRNSAKNMKV